MCGSHTCRPALGVGNKPAGSAPGAEVAWTGTSSSTLASSGGASSILEHAAQTSQQRVVALFTSTPHMNLQHAATYLDSSPSSSVSDSAEDASPSPSLSAAALRLASSSCDAVDAVLGWDVMAAPAQWQHNLIQGDITPCMSLERGERNTAGAGIVHQGCGGEGTCAKEHK